METINVTNSCGRFYLAQEPHPNLEGMDKGEFFAVIEQSNGSTFYWGPYATRNAAQSVLDERKIGRVVQLRQI